MIYDYDTGIRFDGPDCGGDCLEKGDDCNCPSCSEIKKKKKKVVQDSLTQISQIISRTFDAPVDDVISVNFTPYGRFDAVVLSDNKAFRVRESKSFLRCDYIPSMAKELNQYAVDLLAEKGIRTDSRNAFTYAKGFFHKDAVTPKCKNGGTPCGQRCLPKGKKCRKNGAAPIDGLGAAYATGIGAGILATGHVANRARLAVEHHLANRKKNSGTAPSNSPTKQSPTPQKALPSGQHAADRVVDVKAQHVKDSLIPSSPYEAMQYLEWLAE